MLDSYTIAIIVFLSILLLFVCIKIYYAYHSSSSFTSKEDIELIKKLENCGWKLISKKGCIYCEKQLDIINYPHLDITDVRPDVITEIRGVPLWVQSKTGNTLVGLQSKEQLIDIANKC